MRVLFSAPGEIADDVIRRLVAAEPEGRPLMVVSSDKEVATDVARAGAYARAVALLLAASTGADWLPGRPGLVSPAAGRGWLTGGAGSDSSARTGLSYPLLSVLGVTDPEGEL